MLRIPPATVLRQDEGRWAFGGDGRMGDFAPPLAPMSPQTEGTFPVGTRVEVGPTDEGYVGSWFSAVVSELEGGEVSRVELHRDYTVITP